MGARAYKVIEGDPKLFRTKSYTVKKVNAFFGPTYDMDEVEFWEDRLNKMQVPYCLVFHKQLGYTVFLSPLDFCNEAPATTNFVDNE